MVLVTAFRKDTGTIDLSSASYIADTTGATADAVGGNCAIDQSLVDSGSTCITGCQPNPADNVYLNEKEMQDLVTSGDLLFSAYVPQDQNTLDLTGVTTGDFVGVFLQYERGITHSRCLSAEVRENISLTEFNGEDPAKLKTSKCFIATAAFGNPLSAKLTALDGSETTIYYRQLLVSKRYNYIINTALPWPSLLKSTPLSRSLPLGLFTPFTSQSKELS